MAKSGFVTDWYPPCQIALVRSALSRVPLLANRRSPGIRRGRRNVIRELSCSIAARLAGLQWRCRGRSGISRNACRSDWFIRSRSLWLPFLPFWRRHDRCVRGQLCRNDLRRQNHRDNVLHLRIGALRLPLLAFGGRWCNGGRSTRGRCNWN